MEETDVGIAEAVRQKPLRSVCSGHYFTSIVHYAITHCARCSAHLRLVERVEHALQRCSPRELHVHDLKVGLEVQRTHDVI